MYRIITREDLAPQIHLFKIEAPMIAQKVRGEEFAAIRIDEGGREFPWPSPSTLFSLLGR